MIGKLTNTNVDKYPSVKELPSKCFVDSPNLLDKHNYGFLSHVCPKEALKGKYEDLRTKVHFLIQAGVINGDDNGVYLVNDFYDGHLVDKIIITNLNNQGKVVGSLIANNPIPYSINGIHQKSKTREPLYASQTVVSTSKYKYTFSDWDDLEYILETDDDLLYELKYAYSESNLIRFRTKVEPVDIVLYDM